MEDKLVFQFDDPTPDFCEGPRGCELSEKRNGNITDDDCNECMAEHNSYEYI